MAQGIVVEAAQVLWEQLLWVGNEEDKAEENARLSAELAAIQDDVTIVRQGVSFLSPARLQEGEKWMLKQLASVLAARRLYKQRGSTVEREEEIEEESRARDSRRLV
jgi:hypothetical protein